MNNTASRFAVAKYTPDLYRMEPRNIGVIVWTDRGQLVARFLGEQDGGKVKPPAIIERDTRHAYKEWIGYWRYQLASDGITRRDGNFVARSSPDFLAGLMEKSKEHFRLVDGGFLMESLAKKGAVDDFADELFEKLVCRAPESQAHAESTGLIDGWKAIEAGLKLRDRDDYRYPLDIPRLVHGVLRPFKVDFALGPVAAPSAVFQRILLSRHQSIDSGILMFDALLNDGRAPIPKENCVAIVNTRDTDKASADTSSGISVLEKLVNLIDLANSDARDRVAEVAARTATSPL